MANQVAAIGAASDPRVDHSGLGSTSYPTRSLGSLHNPNITFEEYYHYAKVSREQEKTLFGSGSNYQVAPGPITRFWDEKIMRKPPTVVSAPQLSINAQGEGMVEKEIGSGMKGSDNGSPNHFEPMVISDSEWIQASRAARTATWGAIFYLITTDILGPFSTGWAFSQLGFGPGISLFTVFGALSGYTGWQLWRIFIQMDSDRYPMKGYGDIAFRIYGTWARHVANVLQSFQFLLNVSLLIITSGQSISQMSQGNLCFIICVLVSTIAGVIIGQIRTLARFGWLASLAVFMNLAVIFFSMGVIAHSPPNYTAVAASYPNVLSPDQIDNPPPIFHYANLPAGLSLVNNVNGLMQAVFSFGGATLFCELMAEMRHPMDFWKGLICAEILIYLCYLVYGCYCYGIQGQYVFNPSYQGVAPYGWQTFGNVLELITGIIAACLYGNIGIKVLYNNIGRDIFKAPLLESRKGKISWYVIVPIYWIVAFILAASIPQISNFSAFVGAACILQFTYTFPPLLMLGLKAQRDAMLPGETFNAATGQVVRHDSGITRWMRGLKKEWAWNIFDLIFFLGSVTTAVLGIYAAIFLMNEAYKTNANLTGWGCKSPTG